MGLRLPDWLQTAMRHGKSKEGLDSDDRSYVVHVSDSGATISDAFGESEFVAWKELRSVEIEVLSDESAGSEFWWLLIDGSKRHRIPQGTVGEASLMARLQALPGFDNNALRAAVVCKVDHRFLCWSSDVHQGKGWRGSLRL